MPALACEFGYAGGGTAARGRCSVVAQAAGYVDLTGENEPSRIAEDLSVGVCASTSDFVSGLIERQSLQLQV
jgi:hypothetical protein